MTMSRPFPAAPCGAQLMLLLSLLLLLLLLPLLAPAEAQGLGVRDSAALVQGSLLVREVPGTKRAKSRAFSESVLQSAARVGQGMVTVGALESKMKEKIRVLSFGGRVILPTPLGVLGFDLRNVTGEDIMRFALSLIDFLRNDTYVAKVHAFIKFDTAASLNFTGTTGEHLSTLKSVSHQLNDDALFYALMIYFHEAAGAYQNLFHDITSWLTFQLGRPNITGVLVDGIVRAQTDTLISSFNASGGPNCTELKQFVALVSSGHEFIHDHALPGIVAVLPNVTEGITSLFTAIAPDVGPTVSGIVNATKSATLEILAALSQLLYDYKDVFEHTVTHRLCK
mmetsp:Transcript_39161/g.111754  ORF Transcript_39161/g.111754 Transcript_39161/m.111754 type:complete len:339 (-) Transcript_39161:29-1045(-)